MSSHLLQPAVAATSRCLGRRLLRCLCLGLLVAGVQSAQAVVPNDTLYPSQWWLGDYSAAGSAGVPDMPRAWNRSTGSPVSGLGPVVAVLDSGIVGHPDLDAHLVLPGYDFVSNVDYANDGNGRDNDPTDPGDLLTAAEQASNLALWDGCATGTKNSWHGTFIAGEIAAVSNNAAGVAGVNWNGRVLPVRVAGKCGAAAADVVDGMRWAAGLDVTGVPRNANPARIIVVGFAGFESCSLTDPNATVAAAAKLYLDAIAELRAAGVLVVAAAGNERRAVGRPANCAGVFAVAGLNRQGLKSLFSNYGPEVALATVSGDEAQGRTCDTLLADDGILSTSNDGTTAPGTFSYATGSGTSFAAPIVAATASLMLTVNPALSLTQLEAGLRASARPHAEVPALGTCDATKNFSRCQCTTATCGAGILDAAEALAYAADPAGYAAPVRAAVILKGTAFDQCAAAMGLVATPVTPPASGPTTTPTTPTTPTPATPAATNAGGGGGGGGGGALGWEWLAMLALAVVALRWTGRGNRPMPASHRHYTASL